MGEWEDIQAIQDAVQAAINQEAQSEGILTKFVLVAEVLNEDGKKLVFFRGPNAEAIPTWDAKGMIREVIADPQAFTRDEEDE